MATIYGVRRTVILNTVEPGALSLRVPPGCDLALTIQGVLQGGSTGATTQEAPDWPFNGWIELMGRTDGAINKFTLADQTGGLWSVTIPLGSLGDRNGYRISLLGPMFSGAAPQLMAYGDLILMAPMLPPTGRPLVATP